MAAAESVGFKTIGNYLYCADMRKAPAGNGDLLEQLSAEQKGVIMYFDTGSKHLARDIDAGVQLLHGKDFNVVPISECLAPSAWNSYPLTFRPITYQQQ